MALKQQASAKGMAVEGAEDEGEADLAATASMEAVGVADKAKKTRATDAVAADSTASATIITRTDICGAIATSSLIDGPLLMAKRVKEQEEGEEEAVEAVAVAEVVLQRAEMKCMGKAMFKGADGKMVGLKNVLWVPKLAANLISVRRLQKAGMDTSSKGAKTYTTRLGERILWDLHEDRDVYNEMWQIPVVPMPKEKQVAASISTKGEAVGSSDGANEAPLLPQGPAPSGLSQVDPSPLVAPVEVSSDTSGPAKGGDLTCAATVTPRRSVRLAVPPGFLPRLSSPLLQPVAVDSGVIGGAGAGGPGTSRLGGGASHLRAGGTGTARAGGAMTAEAGDSATGGIGVTSAGGTGACRQETLSPERLHEWAVQWGSPGGGASPARTTRAGGAGTTGATGGTGGGAGAVHWGSPSGGARRARAARSGVASSRGASAGVLGVASAGGASAGVPGVGRARGTGTGGTGAAGGTGGAGPVGASAFVLRVGGTGGADTVGATGVGGNGSGGAAATGAGGSGSATTQPQQSGLRHLLSLPPAATEFTAGGTTPLLLEPALRLVTPVCSHRAVRPRPPTVPGTHIMALRPSSFPQRVVLPSPPASSLPHIPDPESDLVRTATPIFTRLLATIVTDPSFDSTAVPPSIGGELALGCDVLEDRQFELECLAAAAPHLASTLLCIEGDPDAMDIPTPRTYAEAITGLNSSQWQIAMDAKMASWKSTGTYVDEVPPFGVNIVDGMWIFRRDYELHSLDFSTTFLQGSLHGAICLWQPVDGLRQAPREWRDTLRTTLAALGFTPSNADPSMFLRTDRSLPPFYVLVYVDNLVFTTADNEALAIMKAELQERHTCTDLGELRSYLGLQITRDRARRTITFTQSHMVHQVLQHFDFSWSSQQPTPLSTGHSLSAPFSDESVEPSGPTSGVGLVLGGRGLVVLTGNSETSWADDQTTHRYEAKIYAGAMAAQELRWLTCQRVKVLGSNPCVCTSGIPVRGGVRGPLRLEHRTKHIALCYFLMRELQQRGQLRLAYMATQANTSDVFTKALGSSDHQRFCTALGLVPTLPHMLFF
ncbi:unnamed protein product [Closterium sp. NIES-53]